MSVARIRSPLLWRSACVYVYSIGTVIPGHCASGGLAVGAGGRAMHISAVTWAIQRLCQRSIIRRPPSSINGVAGLGLLGREQLCRNDRFYAEDRPVNFSPRRRRRYPQQQSTISSLAFRKLALQT